TTVEESAAVAGLTKRTVYNNYGDKESLFREVVGEVIADGEAFTRELRRGLGDGVEAADVPAALDELAGRLVLAIVRPEVIALRRLLVGEAREFPELAREYYERAPARVLASLAATFERLGGSGVLRVGDARCAAEQ